MPSDCPPSGPAGLNARRVGGPVTGGHPTAGVHALFARPGRSRDWLSAAGVPARTCLRRLARLAGLPLVLRSSVSRARALKSVACPCNTSRECDWLEQPPVFQGSPEPHPFARSWRPRRDTRFLRPSADGVKDSRGECHGFEPRLSLLQSEVPAGVAQPVRARVS